MLIKDTRYVTNVSQLLDTLKPDDSAIKLIMTHVELRIRQVLMESLKYSRMLRKETLELSDIECAIKATNLDDSQIRIDIKDASNASELLAPFYSNQDLNIEDTMMEVLNLNEREEPSIDVTWIQIDGRIPFTPENSSINEHAAAEQEEEDSLINNKLKKKILKGMVIKQEVGTSASKVLDP